MPSFAGVVAGWLGLEAVRVVIAACALALLLPHERLVVLTDRPARQLRDGPGDRSPGRC